jgi:uncharacterized protein YdeI (YjbR/CyaY-like superfamily)
MTIWFRNKRNIMAQVKIKSPAAIPIPPDVRKALGKKLPRFQSLLPSHRREHLRAVSEAKKPETRERRIAFLVAKMNTND